MKRGTKLRVGTIKETFLFGYAKIYYGKDLNMWASLPTKLAFSCNKSSLYKNVVQEYLSVVKDEQAGLLYT